MHSVQWQNYNLSKLCLGTVQFGLDYGVSNDSGKVSQEKVNEIPIDKILVLPANVKQSDLLDIYTNYSRLNINFLIFTKLDETKSFGNLISFSHKTKKSITYFSVGQNVPDDLIVSDSTFLIECFMNKYCPRR